MADHKSLTRLIKEEEEEEEEEVEALHVLAPRQIIRNCLTDALKKTMMDLESQLSAIVAIPQSNAPALSEFDKQLKKAEEKFVRWESRDLMIWDSSPVEASKYLKGIEEIQSLIETIGGLSADEYGKKKKNLLYRANRYDDFSLASIDERSSEVSSEKNNNSNESEDYVVDLVHPLGMPHIKSIANVMFASNFGDEFCHDFVNTRKEAFNEYLFDVLGWQKFSIEDVRMMEWTSLNSEMKKWNWIMKIIVRVYLASEKRLCEKILGESDALFTEDAGCVIRNQFHEIVKSLGNLAKTTFVDFENVIASNTSASPFSGGGIHPLTRYVMNFIKTVTDYSDTLNLLLKDQHMEGTAAEIEFEDQKCISPLTLSPTSLHVLSIIGILKSNLESRSKLYHNAALQHVFMMNNLHYMVQKIKNTRLEILFGDEWIRTQKSEVQQHVKDYRVSVKYKITDKYMKYTVDDLEKHLLDLFEGAPRLLNKASTCRK
ncbi:hypothetical protein ACLB2K_049517 [Fragaria x ananassa]